MKDPKKLADEIEQAEYNREVGQIVSGHQELIVSALRAYAAPEDEAKILPSPSAIDLIEEAATFIQDNVGIQDAYIDYEGKTKLLRKISVFLDQCGPQNERKP
jgi:hypothetical protein